MAWAKIVRTFWGYFCFSFKGAQKIIMSAKPEVPYSQGAGTAEPTGPGSWKGSRVLEALGILMLPCAIYAVFSSMLTQNGILKTKLSGSKFTGGVPAMPPSWSTTVLDEDT